MSVVKSLKIVAGIIILLSSMTIIVMVFLEPTALAILFNFSIRITSSSIIEAIVDEIVASIAALVFLIGMLIIGVIYLALSVNFGILTLVLKRSKAVTIIVLLLAGFTLSLEIRAVIILSIDGRYGSIILPVRIVADSIVIAICIYSLIILFRKPSEIKQIS